MTTAHRFSRRCAGWLVAVIGVLMVAGCESRAQRYCFASMVEADGGYFSERDGGFFYERDGGYFVERDGGFFYERDGGFFYERDGVSYPVVCRRGVRCVTPEGEDRCTAP